MEDHLPDHSLEDHLLPNHSLEDDLAPNHALEDHLPPNHALEDHPPTPKQKREKHTHLTVHLANFAKPLFSTCMTGQGNIHSNSYNYSRQVQTLRTQGKPTRCPCTAAIFLIQL